MKTTRIAAFLLIATPILLYLSYCSPDKKKSIEVGILSQKHALLYTMVEDQNLSLNPLLDSIWEVLKSPTSIMSCSAASALVDISAGDLLHSTCFKMDKQTYDMALVDFFMGKYKGETDAFRKQVAAICIREIHIPEANQIANEFGVPAKKELEDAKKALSQLDIGELIMIGVEKIGYPDTMQKIHLIHKLAADANSSLDTFLDSLWQAMKSPSFKTSLTADGVLSDISSGNLLANHYEMDEQTYYMTLADFLIGKYKSETNIFYKLVAANSIRRINDPKANQMADEHGIPTKEELAGIKPEQLRGMGKMGPSAILRKNEK